MTVLDALQVTLGDEHAALYTYGVLGARTSQSATPALYDAIAAGYRRHRARRDQLRVLVEEAGGVPVAAAAAYELDGPLLRAPQVQAAALATEESSVEVLTRPGRPVGRRRARVGARRGDLVGHLAARAGRQPRRPGRARPSSTDRSTGAARQETARGLSLWESPEISPKGRGRGPS